MILTVIDKPQPSLKNLWGYESLGENLRFSYSIYNIFLLMEGGDFSWGSSNNPSTFHPSGDIVQSKKSEEFTPLKYF